MKRFLYNIWVLSIVGLLVSCTGDDTLWKDAGGASIKLQFSDGLLLSRAADDTEAERAIKHLDVFIFDINHQNLIYERINNPATSGEDSKGTVTLKASLSDFKNRGQNYVYVIANATATFTGTESWDNLKTKIQEDLNIHMTGTGLPGMPTHFLMDGIAKNANTSTNTSVTINADANGDVTLEVILERAAAKVEVTLNQGTAYKFLQDASNANRGYYFRNMPYKTTLLDMQDTQGNQIYPTGYLRTPDKANDQQSFNWGADKVVITGYVYSHKWFSGSLESTTGHYYQTGTSLVVNIPLWTDLNNNSKLDEGEDVYLNSYYQIPIVKEETTNTWQIKRNTLYKVEATIEAPGAEDNKEPQTLQNLKYQTEPWKLMEISVGNEMQPKYLEVNKNLLEMHNVATDNTLEFVSSSNVNVKVLEVYYNDKFGVKKNLSTDIVSVTPEEGLTGKITINSVVPTNNTIRYIRLEVINDDTTDSNGLKEEITVLQYPLLYVTNQLGWYSYRDDFKTNDSKPTTYQYRGDEIRRVGLDSWDNETKQWSYNYNESYYFWYSKVVRSTYTDTNNNSYIGRSNIDYYYWEGNSKSYSNAQDPGNARMYHVKVTATSDEYVVGIPAKTTDQFTGYEYTDPSEANSLLVSPSFMIASRLGFVNTGNTSTLSKANTQEKRLAAFRDHCANYVEVAGNENNKVVYDDWRLPTESELKIIMNLQGTSTQSADAIDYLLNAVYYYSASGPVFNSKNDDNVKNEPNNKDLGTSSWSVRCVRDNY